MVAEETGVAVWAEEDAGGVEGEVVEKGHMRERNSNEETSNEHSGDAASSRKAELENRDCQGLTQSMTRRP